jgi:hypothetical protein
LGEFIDVFQKYIFTEVGARVILIWKIRNRVVHEGIEVNQVELHRGLHVISQEIWKVNESLQPKQNKSLKVMWSKPDWNSYKINCDAVVSESHAVISIVARDWRGFLVFAYAMRVNTNSLVQAEAEAYR